MREELDFEAVRKKLLEALTFENAPGVHDTSDAEERASTCFVILLSLIALGLFFISMSISFNMDPLVSFAILGVILFFTVIILVKFLGFNALALILDGFGPIVGTERRNELAWGLGFSFAPENDSLLSKVVMVYSPSLVPERSQYTLTFRLQYRVPTFRTHRTHFRFTTQDKSSGRAVEGAYAYEIISPRDDVRTWLQAQGGELLDSVSGLHSAAGKGYKVRFVLYRKFKTPSGGRETVLKLRKFITELERLNVLET